MLKNSSNWLLAALAVIITAFAVISAAPASPAAWRPVTRLKLAERLAGLLQQSGSNVASGNWRSQENIKELIIEFRRELDLLGVETAQTLPAYSESPSPYELLPIGHWAYKALDELASSISEKRRYVFRKITVNGSAYVPYALPQRETARYAAYSDNNARLAAHDPVATFSLDVSTASYSNVRRFLLEGRLPDPGAVRVEELINYFPAIQEEADHRRIGESPFRVAYELAPSPWDAEKTLLWVSIAANELDYSDAPDANLVFLVDVSGSMSTPERLPLVKSALKMLVGRLRPTDSISLVTYAGSTEVVLKATTGSEKGLIISAIDRLGAGGPTSGATGLALAYEQALSAYKPGGVNRILLCTDGDFNVGPASDAELKAIVERERESGVTLSVFGFGTDNLNDSMMTEISSAGNGNYSYIDSMMEARKIMGEEMSSTLVTVAKDVKAQIEFNPANVMEYRQIGYEKRQLENEDFSDDTADAGDIGAGKRVTILYELMPPDGKPGAPKSRYQQLLSQNAAVMSEDLGQTNMTGGVVAYLKFRWKEPDGDKSSLVEMPVMKGQTAKRFEDAGTGLRFSAAVAAYGQKLRKNESLSGVEWEDIASWSDGAREDDPYRAEFMQLVKLASAVSRMVIHRD